MLKLCDVMKRIEGGAILLLAGLAMSACATDGASSEEAQSQPLAEVGLENGSRVLFYEPSPGALAVAEQRAFGVAPADTAGKSPLEIYRSIAPGQPVPALLAAAQARSDEARRDRPAREVPQQPAFAGSSASITADEFDRWYCQDPYYSFRTCHLGTTTELDGTHYDIDEFKVTMCVNSGKVELRVWVEDEKKLDVQLLGGDCITYHWWSGLFNADSIRVKTDILSATANYDLTVKWNR